MKIPGFAPLLTRNLAHWLFLCVALLLGAPASAQSGAQSSAQAQSITLSVAQVRAMAHTALASGNAQLALKLAEGLLIADAQDSFAFYIVAKAHQLLGDKRAGRRAASRAFQYAGSPQDKFTLSQLAARLAYEENRPTLSQVWLRRSANFAPSDQHKDQIGRDYRRLRAENPWNTQLRFSVAPSSNVNAGSDSAYSIIDGVPIIGLLSRDAQALSGTVAIADISTSYRLHRDENSSLTLMARLYTRQILLSAASQRSVPTLRNRNFSATTAQAGLKYVFRLGAPRNTVSLRGDVGKNWYAGAPVSTFARVTLGRTQHLSAHSNLSYSTSYEHRAPSASWRTPTQLIGLRGTLRHRLSGGDTLRIGLDLKKVESATVNTASTSATAYLGYDLGKEIAAAQISLRLGASYQDYPVYSVGFIRAPGGRQDATIFSSATFTFKNMDYAGFIPTVTLRAQQNHSNISRFDTTQFSVAVGIRSRF